MSLASERQKRIKVLAEEIAQDYQANLAALGQDYADSRALQALLIWADPSPRPGIPGRSAWPQVHEMLLALMEVHPGIQRLREAERRTRAGNRHTTDVDPDKPHDREETP